MAALDVSLGAGTEVTLATTLQQLVPLSGVRAVYVRSASAVYVSLDDAKSDGDAISATNRFAVPADTVFPIPVTGAKIFIAALSGTPVAWVFGA